MVKYTSAIKDFSGGLSEVANDNIPDNRLVTAKNAIPGDGYGISRAMGTSVAFEQIPAEEPEPVVMLTELEDVNAITHIIACTSTSTENGIRWHLWDWDGEEWTLGETSGGDSEIRPMLSWFVYANKLFWLDGNDFSCYDGSNIADVPNSQSMDAIYWTQLTTSISVVQRNTRWFYATRDNEVIITDPGYYDKFTPTTNIKITSGVADRITALHLFNEGILIFQERNIYYLTGWDIAGSSDVKMVKLSVECGTRWPKSIKTISNAVLYLGDNGLYQLGIPYYTSSIAAKNISEKQCSKRLTEMNAIDVYAEVFNGIYHIALRAASGTIKEYRLYLDSGGWWGEYTQRPYCFASKLGGDNHLYIGCENGYVLYYDENSYHYVATETGGPAAIPVEIMTKGYDVVGRTVIDSKVKRVFLVLKQYDAEHSGLTVQYKTDYLEGAYAAEVDSMHRVMTAVLQDIEGDESLVWDEGFWSKAYWGWIDTVTKQFQVNRKCKRIQFVFRDDNSDEPLLIYGVALLFKKKKAKGSRMGVTPRSISYKD